MMSTVLSNIPLKNSLVWSSPEKGSRACDDNTACQSILHEQDNFPLPSLSADSETRTLMAKEGTYNCLHLAAPRWYYDPRLYQIRYWNESTSRREESSELNRPTPSVWRPHPPPPEQDVQRGEPEARQQQARHDGGEGGAEQGRQQPDAGVDGARAVDHLETLRDGDDCGHEGEARNTSHRVSETSFLFIVPKDNHERTSVRDLTHPASCRRE
ncbi:hypothetical protein MYCTH_2112769 [Thermothelomyces thermophilus ATCC 42464]|uniref:Uncharacterized protein n=1 Tax=Thermothelomyces thermophilus (strain ATCC 42464 / BCRC 31852 / DSM 1799) TaxID=573729 RepID=G2QLA7_THET4|nr:uncharacterized protein MYCTH_2112769 [Thermothelomyces thermophilus ATCC 42464]AEO60739.1 hypothetical protein MYCTH_2112769 [Thermothelomyces thermophilus ATCC 42464]